MTIRYYWPYDEVTVDLSEDQQQLVIKTPWLQASLPLATANLPVAAELVDKFKNQRIGQEDLELISNVFQSVASYPFCYTLPRSHSVDSAQTMDLPALRDHDLIYLTPPELLLETIRKSEGQQNTLAEEAVKQLAQQLERLEWEWDAEAAMTFAKTETGIHPESLLSVIRRFHLLEVMEHDQGSDIFQKIKALPEASYKQIASLLIRQNHFVTQQCQSALEPALHVAGRARAQVAAFMAEEKGHDLILGSALRTMTDDPESLPVCAATRTLMHLLRFVAGRNLLAFSMVIEMFERSSYEATDPLAQLLAQGGFDKAARQVNRHKEINDAGEHENISASFLRFMAPCEPDYAYEAIRLAELVSVVSNSVTRSVWRLFHETSPGL